MSEGTTNDSPPAEAGAGSTTEPPPVVVIHGLGVHPWIMAVLAWRIRRSGRRVHLVGYNSYHVPIPQIAQRVSRKVRRLGYEEIDVVAHSMGGIITRYILNHMPMPRVRRIVMIGTPNRGASLATTVIERLGPVGPAILGEVLHQMRHGDKGLAARVGLLEGIEFGVIAGGNRTKSGMRSWIKGDNDGIVAVAETPLEGMRDFVHVPVGHTMQLVDRRVAEYALHFLDHGRFRGRAKPRAHAENEDG